ncbi:MULTISPECIES: energy-coupling factor ABC transporter ATP-binding protein [Aerococcus]|nr:MULTISPECIES: energy-coupling factor ABC transporter ATP-binding protein [Aerococcus]KAA9232551.1 energy-coupling factor ABC transporter ATP-binding protein [Aerococcus mictus]MBU5610517.1 energy-coupling factor ABC transporter ATP-binding protein [Aerococcus urinae]MDK6291747.1 energy-coupling factor ABC transporter ATP-binding protein [Aerococcus urinae]MDK6376011.1 energy-coupling factor ABC transporter ATP-binding protein [Aerococcus urinae]MDK6420332.1 energy-coupling factor ABC transp
MESIISVKDVSFRYDKEEDKQTIKQVSFDIFDQEWVAIIGHNGSGKSTMAKLIDGLLEAESGQITVAGLALNEANVWTIRQNIGLVFQNPDNQFVGATVEDDVAFGLENAAVPHDEMVERVNWALEEVGMSAYRQYEPSNLSGGQKQRVAIAGIIALQPRVIILDEATSMLDPEGREEVMEVIRRLKEKSQLTVLSITHDLSEAASADRILVFRQGEIVNEGKPAEIFSYGDKLIDMGLGVPFSVQLKNALAQRGFSFEKDYYTEEGLVDWLCKLNSKA